MTGTEVEFQVSGRYALFSDPVTRVTGQKHSYLVPTGSAMTGILGSIYKKPTFHWIVDKVRVMERIRIASRGVRPIHYQDGKNDLAYYTYLCDVCYQVKAHFEWNVNRPEFICDRDVVKHLAIAQKAIRKGGRRPVFLGTSECPAIVEPCVFGEGDGYYDGSGERDFGIMVHSLVYPDEAYSDETRGHLTLNMWRAVMHDGVLEFIRPEACTISKTIREMPMRAFPSRKEVV